MLPLPGMESEALTPFSPSLQISALLEGGKTMKKLFTNVVIHLGQLADTVQLFANGKNV